MEAREDGNVLVSKPNATSAVWRFFRFTDDGSGKPKDLDKPICSECKATISANGGNTSNLFAQNR